jgi:short subunit fatty acids transporter
MTPERKTELLALMEDVTHREIKRLVAEFQSGRAEAAPISERLAALGEITACIHTAFAVLSGEVFAKVIARKVDQEADGRDAAREIVGRRP